MFGLTSPSATLVVPWYRRTASNPAETVGTCGTPNTHTRSHFHAWLGSMLIWFDVTIWFGCGESASALFVVMCLS